MPGQDCALSGDLALWPADDHSQGRPASGAGLPKPGDEGHGKVLLEVRHTFNRGRKRAGRVQQMGV